MNEQPNLREWTRVDHALDVRMVLDAGGTLQGTSRNISANGVLIEDVTNAKIGEQGDVTLSREEGDSKLEIRGRGEIVRSGAGGTAIQLTALTGEESYAAMRNLIVYNAADHAGQADKEFQEHIGLKRPKT